MESSSSLQRAPDGREVSTYLFRAGLNFAKRHYVLSTCYLVGLVVLQFATGFAVGPKQYEVFQQDVRDINVGRVQQLWHQTQDAYQDYRNNKGWFSCDSKCMEKYEYYTAIKSRLELAELENERILSNARAKVGVFSEFAVSDARDMFWDAFHGGKEMAKRMSYFDLLWGMLNSMGRDDSVGAVVLRWLLQVALNITTAMIVTLFSFAFKVGSLIASFQPSPLGAVSFFVLAVAGAFSVLLSFVLASYVVVASAAYVTVVASAGRLRVEGGRTGQRIGGGRTHYE